MFQSLIDISVNQNMLIAQKLNELNAMGYELKFRREAACIYCFEWQQWIMPANFRVDLLYYFEKTSNPDEDRMLYAISLSQGGKGFLIDSCNAYMDNISEEMIRKLKLNEFTKEKESVNPTMFNYSALAMKQIFNKQTNDKNMKTYDSLVDALSDLRKRGYDADFEPQSDCLYCRELDMRLNEAEFHIDEAYRFEGNSDPDDNAVVYALTSPTGVKGTIVDGYGVSSDNISFEMAKKLGNHPA